MLSKYADNSKHEASLFNIHLQTSLALFLLTGKHRVNFKIAIACREDRKSENRNSLNNECTTRRRLKKLICTIKLRTKRNYFENFHLFHLGGIENEFQMFYAFLIMDIPLTYLCLENIKPF